MSSSLNKLSSDSLIRQHADYVSVEIKGKVLLMHIVTGNHLDFNDVASFIWKQLAKPTDIASLTRAVQVEFAVDEASCAKDTLKFVQRMLDDGVVEIVSA
jgi:hypothetical protein